MRGVDVRLLVSDWAIKGKKGESLKKLKQNGVQVRYASIPEHSSGKIPFARTIHSKLLTIDDQKCWLGTSNWSKDYFTTSRNVGILILNPKDCLSLSKQFNRLYIDTWSQNLP